MSKDLSVMYDENLTFIDYSESSRSFISDPFTVSYLAGPNNHLYFGLYKPFYNLFAELTAIAEDVILLFEYFDGTIWKPLSVTNETNKLKRSGFLRWERELEDWSSSSVDGKDNYYIRMSADIDYTAIFEGLNLVFSDDNDLVSIERKILNQLSKGDTSFIAYLVAARDEIIQRYRNSGNSKRKENGTFLENLTKWDLLDIENIRQASKFLTMAKIHFDISEQTEDKYYQRYMDYMGLFGDSFALSLKRLDTNDDGKLDVNENNNPRSIEMRRL